VSFFFLQSRDPVLQTLVHGGGIDGCWFSLLLVLRSIGRRLTAVRRWLCSCVLVRTGVCVTRMRMTGGRFLRWRRCGWSIDWCKSGGRLRPLCLSLCDAVHHQGVRHATKCEELSVPQTGDKAKAKTRAVQAENRPENHRKIRDGPANDFNRE